VREGMGRGKKGPWWEGCRAFEVWEEFVESGTWRKARCYKYRVVRLAMLCSSTNTH
jgi:hypothetical protein